jgi:hypothetical protein
MSQYRSLAIKDWIRALSREFSFKVGLSFVGCLNRRNVTVYCGLQGVFMPWDSATSKSFTEHKRQPHRQRMCR